MSTQTRVIQLVLDESTKYPIEETATREWYACLIEAGLSHNDAIQQMTDLTIEHMREFTDLRIIRRVVRASICELLKDA